MKDISEPFIYLQTGDGWYDDDGGLFVQMEGSFIQKFNCSKYIYFHCEKYVLCSKNIKCVNFLA
jgi:hypothetical protein